MTRRVTAAEVRAALLPGVRFIDVARALGIDRGTVSRVANRFGIEPPPAPPARPKPPRRRPSVKADFLASVAAHPDWWAQRHADLLNVTRERITQLATICRIQLPNSPQARTKTTTATVATMRAPRVTNDGPRAAGDVVRAVLDVSLQDHRLLGVLGEPMDAATAAERVGRNAKPVRDRLRDLAARGLVIRSVTEAGHVVWERDPTTDAVVRAPYRRPAGTAADVSTPAPMAWRYPSHRHEDYTTDGNGRLVHKGELRGGLTAYRQVCEIVPVPCGRTPTRH